MPLAKSAKAVVAAVMCFSVTSAAHAVTINIATGQDALGVNQTGDGLLDAYWTQSGAYDPLSGSSTYVIGAGGRGSAIGGGWDSNGPNSSWIAPNPHDSDDGYSDGSGNSFTVTYTYTFDLTGYDLTTAAFSGGGWGVDNSATAYLNGTLIDDSGGGGYFSLVPFDLPVADLVAGLNTLTVLGTGDFATNAIRVEGTLTVDAPEPGTFTLLGAGLLALRAATRRKAKTA
jgi:hypothetical protein